MGKLATSLAALSLLGGLAACDSDATTAPPPTPSPTPTSATPSPSASASPTPPAMPDAAKAHTTAGAKAFVTYYWQVVDYAQNNLDVNLLSELSLPTCTGCRSGIQTISDVAAKRGYLHGGASTISFHFVEGYRPNHSVAMSVTIKHAALHQYYPGEGKTTIPAGTTDVLLTVVPRRSGWLLAEIKGA